MTAATITRAAETKTANGHRPDEYNRCGFCGQFVAWAWWSAHSVFAGDDRAYCPRVDCIERAGATPD